MLNVACELSQPMGKTEFSSVSKNKTFSVLQVRKNYPAPVNIEQTLYRRYENNKSFGSKVKLMRSLVIFIFLYACES